MLIEPSALRAHLGDSTWIVFDCRHDLFNAERGAKLFTEGHVPGAFFAPVETVLSGPKTGTNGRHPLPGAAAFAEFLNQHGVTPEKQIVAYDDVGGQYASRLWWLARWIGLTRVAVLDGGYPAWIAAGHPVTTAVVTPTGGGSVVARPNPALVMDTAAIESGIRTQSCLVIDARAPERFRGEVEPIDRVAGHIPSAQNRFFKQNLNADLTMRPAAELRREFEALLAGRNPAQVAHQCGSGVTACVNLLAMEHAGLNGSCLYPGSWSEWISDPTRPIASGG
jgi:thiosulfate/3-mercaptopyruvate sulfurtransferase